MKPDAIAYPPRGLSREEAARYVGVSPSKFDQLVTDKRMPKPARVDGRVIWDRLKLDAYFSELEAAERSWLDDKMAEGKQFSGLIK